MDLEAGQRLLHYSLIEKIGEGGMGVVWKALDTSLDRQVAIKILPDDFAASPERKSRFAREARLLASLNHPNIAAVYGLHEEASLNFIAMELVDGETLADRLGRSGLSIEETLEIGVQIAEALETAHDGGIVHRDLKPANIKIRPDGTVKVLDFGLARAVLDDASAASPEAPTATVGTTPGLILGTVPYMSPEQARGKPVDKRADIWAFGCVLYECLAGSRPFSGDSTTDVLAQIVTRQPDFDSLPPTTPDFLSGIVRRCLEKDARRRLRDAGEARIAIETFRSNPAGAAAPVAAPRGAWLPWGIVGAFAIGLLYMLTQGGPALEAPVPNVSRWTIPLPPETRVDLPGPGGKFAYSNTVAISPDGSRIVFSVLDRENHAQFYLKADAATPQAIPGTTDARGPFFSPDGQWLGFYREGELWKVALRGGSPQKICDIGGRAIAFDAAWSPDGKTILFTDNGVWRVSAEEGVPQRLTRPDAQRGELGHSTPRFTADGLGVLFTVSGSGKTSLALLPFDGATWEVVLSDAALGLPVGPDRIVFARSGELFGVRFDSRTRQIVGSPVPVLQGVHTAPGLGGAVVTWFDVSENGTLVYVPAAPVRPDEQLLWVDFDGTESVIAEGPGTWVHPRLSPDFTRISLDIHSADGMRDVYIYQLERKQFQQLTRTGVTWESEWTPDGEQLAVLSGVTPGRWDLHRIRTDFSGTLELLAESNHGVPGSWVDEGRALIYTEWNHGGVFRVATEGDRTPQPVFATQRYEGFPRVSPDGKWIAYVATELVRRDVFVQSFPDMGAIHKVSIDGGREPVWARDGKRLFYRKDKQMLVTDVTYGATISFGRSRLLFEGEYEAAELGHQHYDISRNSDRFLMIRHGQPSGPTEVRTVLNWDEELRSLLGGGETE